MAKVGDLVRMDFAEKIAASPETYKITYLYGVLQSIYQPFSEEAEKYLGNKNGGCYFSFDNAISHMLAEKESIGKIVSDSQNSSQIVSDMFMPSMDVDIVLIRRNANEMPKKSFRGNADNLESVFKRNYDYLNGTYHYENGQVVRPNDRVKIDGYEATVSQIYNSNIIVKFDYLNLDYEDFQTRPYFDEEVIFISRGP